MKMKKFALLFSMIAVFFTLTACSSGTEEVSFDYTDVDIIYSTISQASELQNVTDGYRAYLEDYAAENDLAATLNTGVSNFDNAAKECGAFEGYRSKENGTCINFDFDGLTNAQDQESYDAALAAAQEFIGNVDASVTEDGGNVTVTLKAVYEKRDVEYTFVYEENPAYAYSYELTGNSVAPYQLKEVTATPEYTFSEKMGKAGANTLMGMGTVFVVLIFISLIIGQFEKINNLVTGVGNKKKQNESQTASAPVVSVNAQPTTSAGNLMEDSQLVAVITAAVVAASQASGGSDRLVVRSIRKAKR